jgi:hypothetical protein
MEIAAALVILSYQSSLDMISDLWIYCTVPGNNVLGSDQPTLSTLSSLPFLGRISTWRLTSQTRQEGSVRLSTTVVRGMSQSMIEVVRGVKSIDRIFWPEQATVPGQQMLEGR